MGSAAGRGPPQPPPGGPPWGRGRVGVTAGADRLEGWAGRARGPICRAEKLGRAVRARGLSLSAGAFGVRSSRQVLCLREDCQALRWALPSASPGLPPPLTALSPPPCFSLLSGWVITGSSCQARLEELLPGLGVCRPSQLPLTSPGLRPGLSGLMEPPWWVRPSFPFRPQLSPEDFDSHFPPTKCESGKLRFFGFRKWGDTAGSAAFCRIYSCGGRFHASATMRKVPG